jgi:hypothetical protein
VESRLPAGLLSGRQSLTAALLCGRQCRVRFCAPGAAWPVALLGLSAAGCVCPPVRLLLGMQRPPPPPPPAAAACAVACVWQDRHRWGRRLAERGGMQRSEPPMCRATQVQATKAVHVPMQQGFAGNAAAVLVAADTYRATPHQPQHPKTLPPTCCCCVPSVWMRLPGPPAAALLLRRCALRAGPVGRSRQREGRARCRRRGGGEAAQ